MVISDEQLRIAQKNYYDHLINVVGKCPHDQKIVFDMMGDETSRDEHAYVFKCSKCDGRIWELRNDTFHKMIVTPNEKYLCRWEKITPQEEPRLLPFVGITVKDVARQLFIDISKHTWKDLQ